LKLDQRRLYIHHLTMRDDLECMTKEDEKLSHAKDKSITRCSNVLDAERHTFALLKRVPALVYQAERRPRQKEKAVTCDVQGKLRIC